MIFAHSSDKSKCNLGELSDLPDSSKTPFENIAKVQSNKTWKLIGRTTGTTSAISFNMSDYETPITELMIVCRYGNGDSAMIRTTSVNIPVESILLGVSHNIFIGNPTFNGYCFLRYMIDITIRLVEFNFSNADVSSATTIELYGKE